MNRTFSYKIKIIKSWPENFDVTKSINETFGGNYFLSISIS